MGRSSSGMVRFVGLAGWLAAATVARAEGGGQLVTQGLQMQGLQMQGLQMQGLQMQGVDLAGVRLREARLRGVPLDAVEVVGGGLRARVPGAARVLSGPELVGAVLSGELRDGRRVELQLRGVEADAGDVTGETQLYDLRLRTPRGWTAACRPDGAGVSRAIPLSGVWDARGAHHDSPDHFTFGCTSGVLAKCVRWGYRPWRQVGGRSLADHHQACTRLARADYCGDGTPHTREGTVVNVYDELGIQEQAAAPGLYFEAAWTPEGAYCISKARLGLLPTEVLAECPERLSLPRLGDVSGPDRCLLRLSERDRSEALLSNRSFALLR